MAMTEADSSQKDVDPSTGRPHPVKPADERVRLFALVFIEPVS
jgi:hypothetical protein